MVTNARSLNHPFIMSFFNSFKMSNIIIQDYSDEWNHHVEFDKCLFKVTRADWPTNSNHFQQANISFTQKSLKFNGGAKGKVEQIPGNGQNDMAINSQKCLEYSCVYSAALMKFASQNNFSSSSQFFTFYSLSLCYSIRIERQIKMRNPLHWTILSA